MPNQAAPPTFQIGDRVLVRAPMGSDGLRILGMDWHGFIRNKDDAGAVVSSTMDARYGTAIPYDRIVLRR